MTASEGSFLGFAKQAARGTAITADNAFTYLLYNEGSIAPQNVSIPLGSEVGGGALLRNVVKVGVTSGGGAAFTPRPNSLGAMLLGATGRCATQKKFIDVLAAPASLTGQTVSTGFTQPPAATKLFVKGMTAAAGDVVINGTVSGSADSETVTLTGANKSLGSLTFKTVTQIDYPSGSGAITVKAADGDAIHAAVTLGNAPQAVITDLSNPSPAQAIAVISDGTSSGTVRVYGTNASDAAIHEEIYCYPYEYLESTKTYSAVTSVVFPTSDGQAAIVRHGGAYQHNFFLDYFDNFAAPYYTFRNAPGNLWGEYFKDARFNQLGLEFRAANFMTGSFGLLGGEPVPVATTTWGAISQVDGGPQFLAPIGSIQLPTGTALSVLSGGFISSMQIPLDEQWIVGSYSPENFELTSRAFVLSLNVKVTDDVLYKKMSYDPDGGAAWAAKIMREADFAVTLGSDQNAATGTPYSITFSGNGQSGNDANVVWSAAPISARAGRQLIMNITGVFLADPAGYRDPINIQLVNTQASY